MKRVFIAIELTKEIKDQISKIGQNQPLDRLRARWIKPEHMHLTLVFLGDIEEGKISEIEEICRKVAENFSSFEISFQGLGAFPKPKRAHNLWIDIKNSDHLINLQQELSGGLKIKGFRIEDREFKPHLTLARFRRREDLSDKISQFKDKNFGQMKIENLFIFESLLTPEGPIHKKIGEFRLIL